MSEISMKKENLNRLLNCYPRAVLNHRLHIANFDATILFNGGSWAK
jgi:hypothetical protein